MPHNPDSIVRLLYGERTAEIETAPKCFPFNPAKPQFDIPLLHGQDHRPLLSVAHDMSG